MAINPQLVHHKLHHKLHHQVVVQARCSYIMLCHEIDLTPSIAGFTSKQAYKMGIPAIGIVAVLVANVTFSAWQSPPGKNPAPPPPPSACMQHLPCSAAASDTLASVDLHSAHKPSHVTHAGDWKERHQACKSSNTVVKDCQHTESGSRHTLPHSS